MVGLKNGHIRKDLTQNGEPLEIQLGNAEEEEEEGEEGGGAEEEEEEKTMSYSEINQSDLKPKKKCNITVYYITKHTDHSPG